MFWIQCHIRTDAQTWLKDHWIGSLWFFCLVYKKEEHLWMSGLSWEHLKNTIIIKDKPSQKSSTFFGVRTDPGQRQSNWVKFSLFNYSFVAYQYQPAKEKRIIELWALRITTEGKERRKEWGAWPAVFTDICLKILHVVLFVALDLLYVVVGFEWKTCFWTSFWNWSFSPIQQAKISKVTRKHAIFYSSTQISLFQYLLTIWLLF